MDTIKKQLTLLNKSQLIDVIAAVYGIDQDIDDIVELHLSIRQEQKGQQGKLGDALQKKIHQLGSEDYFIDYHESYSFSCRLESLLIDFDTLIRPDSPFTALQLVDAFLEISPQIMQRVDDSDGDIGEIFSQTVDLWLDIAQQVRSEQVQNNIDWVSRVMYYFEHNDYGLFDTIISGSFNLLTKTELKQLAWRFENDLKKALPSEPEKKVKKETGKELKQNTDYNAEASHASLGMQAVAEALEDITLYEKATLIQFPEPNSVQKAGFAQFALSINNPEQAMKWLQQPWSDHFEHRRQSLFDECLRQQGKTTELKQIFYQRYKTQPSHYSLLALLEAINKQEQQALIQQVLVDATAQKNIEEAINMLIAVDEVNKAADVLIQRADELGSLHYSTLVDWLKSFENGNNSLVKILCYRSLLNDVLNRGYNKAYHHAADYFNNLLRLDNDVSDYKNQADAKEYILSLQQRHWRKRSFWEQARYPNKPVK